MTGQPILIEPAGDAERRLWQTTNEITVLLESIRWVLIGGQMLTIIEREHGGGIGRATVDVDALLDVRATVGAPRRAASLLRSAGFDAQPTADGLAYRFVRDTDIVDLLAPEHLGSRADLTTEPPWVTLEAVGGTQALARRRMVTVAVDGDAFEVPVPSLLGALVIKARAAAGSQDHRDKHKRDLARLLVLVDDLDAIRAQMTTSDRRHMGAVRALTDPAHPAWLSIPRATDGAIALERILVS